VSWPEFALSFGEGEQALMKHFPFGRLGHVFDQASVMIADSPSGEAERVSPEKTVEVVIDELPVERDVVRHQDSAAFGVLL